MRSSKSRSRSKSNRNNRSVGNIVNRVFDSSGPEGKVRGTPQQIIDKYTQLARDAQLSNDRVAFENFQQHAEHYSRMLAEAMREQEQRREQQEHQQNQNQNQRDRQQGRDDRQDESGEPARGGAQADPQPEETVAEDKPKRRGGRGQGAASGEDSTSGSSDTAGSSDVMDVDEQDSGLVETPENKPAKPRRSRARKKDQPESGSGDGDSNVSDSQQAAE